MLIKEDRIIVAFQNWLQGCDADELARVTGELFGGECFARFDRDISDEPVYLFEPNEFYCGEFDE